jgi:hypothetical protein
MNTPLNKKSIPALQAAFSTARQHGHEAEAAMVNLEILMQSIFEKIDQISEASSQTTDVVAAINCYATCALTQVAAAKLHNTQMMDIIGTAMDGGRHA